MEELPDRERLVNDESAGSHGSAQRRPDRSLQVVRADDQIEPLGWQSHDFEVVDPQCRVTQDARFRPANPGEVAINAEHSEPQLRGKLGMTTGPHRQVQQVSPVAHLLAHDRQPPHDDGRRGLSHVWTRR